MELVVPKIPGQIFTQVQYQGVVKQFLNSGPRYHLQEWGAKMPSNKAVDWRKAIGHPSPICQIYQPFTSEYSETKQCSMRLQ
jgi:hypothetical protein